ncbi:MAG TPA: PA14 domain-containing protein, partial [Tepidisphaeraceae bacterium]|nr:PA14 domain-containing protein [Tepidisphaeraceae bacterium]
MSDYGSDTLERRLLLAAVVAPPDPVIYSTSVDGPLAPRPGHTFYVSGYNAQGVALSQWANASAITPNTTNDLVLNVSPSAMNYLACCEAAGGTLGANLLTNGITQTQTAPSPGPGLPAIGDGGASDPSNDANVVASGTGQIPYFIYNLGTAGGAAPSPLGYDLSEIDIISGHQDQNTDIFDVDVLVKPVGTSQFLSLSNGQGFSLTTVPDGQGGTVYVDKGSSQLAIVSSTPGEPLAQNIQAVELVAPDPTTFLREFVVTGTPSASAPPAAPLPPGVVAADTLPAGSTVVWSASANAIGYTVMRSTSSSGPYAAVGSVVGQTSFVDSTAQPNTTYYYEVMASGAGGDSGPSSPSPAAVTTNFGATAYIYSRQLWQGTPAIVENLPQINYRGGQESSAFPFQQGFNAETFSAFIEGKVTTDLAGSYTFAVSTDDDGYLWVDGQLVSANPGSHVQQGPTTTIPITLAANTAYDFVFLENQRGGQWGFTMSWQEPQSNGTPGPLTVVPSSHLSPTVDTPPIPQQVAASVLSANSVQVTWNPAGDASSYGYVVERAPATSNGTQTGPFAVVGQVFSGPTTAGAVPSLTWGCSSFVDTSAAPNSTYIYEIGAILPGQSVPTSIGSPTHAVSTPPTVSASLTARILSITLPGANDQAWLAEASNQITVSQSGSAVYTVPQASVDSILATGSASLDQLFYVSTPLSVPGTITATQIGSVIFSKALSASAVTIVANGNAAFYQSVTTTGPVNADAGSSGQVYVGSTLDTGGNPITFRGYTIQLMGAVNAGSANVNYSIVYSPDSLNLLENTITSGAVTLTTPNSGGFSFSGVANTGLTGTVVLDLPLVTLMTNGVDTSAGNANLIINAESLAANGPLETGTGSLALNAFNATILDGISAGAITIPAGDSVALNGGTLTAQSLTNAGSFKVATGAAASIAGAVSGGGSLFVGTPAGSGTVAYYRFEGTAGTAATGTGSILDSSGNGFNATPENGPTYTSSVPVATIPGTGAADTTSMSFNGTNQGVVIPDGPAFQLTHSLTLEAYVYAEALSGSDGMIIFRGDDQSGLD